MSIKIPISGMHCRSCEILVEDNLKKISGVDKVNVNHKTGQAEIFYHGPIPNQNDIKSAVTTAGYTVGIKGKLPLISKETSDYRNLLLAAAILFVLYGLAKWFGLFELNINTASTSLGVVLLVGLVAGVSTCMALVGGLVLSLSARHAEIHPEATSMQKFRPHLYFNLGRIVGYAFLGGLIGLIGSAFKLSAGLLGILTIAVGLVMLFLGLKLIEIFPALKEKNIALPKFVSRWFGITREQKEYSHKSAMLTGALTFFLPCGFTQAMQLLAVSSGSFATGAATMGLFALGTAPGLLGVGGLASVFKGQKARVFFVVAGLLVILLGGYNIVNGSRLLSTVSLKDNNPIVVNNGDVQEVRMTQGSNGYSPNVFTVEKGKTVRWIINSESVYSCASYIMMPKFKISKALSKGENIITFTPTETGEIPFSCSMGMYRGKFIVVDKLTSSPITQEIASVGGGTCGGSGGGCGGCGGCGGGNIKSNSLTTGNTVSAISVVGSGETQIIKSNYSQINDVAPNEFTVKKGQPVKWVITMNEPPTNCMRNIVISDINISKSMSQFGDTVIEFIPQEKGDLWVTCSMGMHRATIHVV